MKAAVHEDQSSIFYFDNRYAHRTVRMLYLPGNAEQGICIAEQGIAHPQ
jgi:hypothetical protein